MAKGEIPNEEERAAASRLIDAIFAQNEPGTMNDAFVSMHEMFLGLRAAGFNEYQALWLVGYTMVGNGKDVSNAG